MTGPDVVRQAEQLAGEVAVDLYDDFWAKTRHRYGSPAVEYEPISLEEREELEESGIAPADDPYWTALRRKSDGQLFEIEIEVTARAVDAPPPQQEIPGQQDLAHGGDPMTARRMFRYEVPIDDQPHTIPLSHDPVAVAVAASGLAVEFWAESGQAQINRAFQVFGTGHPLPGAARWVGTCPRTPEGLVWHLYEVTP